MHDIFHVSGKRRCTFSYFSSSIWYDSFASRQNCWFCRNLPFYWQCILRFSIGKLLLFLSDKRLVLSSLSESESLWLKPFSGNANMIILISHSMFRNQPRTGLWWFDWLKSNSIPLDAGHFRDDFSFWKFHFALKYFGWVTQNIERG